jgi:tetratricopeptide (TPR) repeat protein
VATLQQSLEIYRELLKIDPVYQSHVASTVEYLGTLYAEARRVPEAIAAYQEALGMYQQLVKTDPAYQEHVTRLSDVLAKAPKVRASGKK